VYMCGKWSYNDKATYFGIRSRRKLINFIPQKNKFMKTIIIFTCLLLSKVLAQSNKDCTSDENFKGNKLDNHLTGLRIESTGSLGTQTHRGNTWWTNQAVGQKQGVNNNLDPSANVFYVDGNLSTNDPGFTYRPTNITTANPNWFQQRTLLPGEILYTNCGNSSICLNNNFQARMAANATDILIADGDVPFEEYYESLNKEADKDLYEKLIENSDLLTDPDFAYFKADKDDEALGQFIQLDKQMELTLDADASLKVARELKEQQINQLESDIATMKALYDQASNEPDRMALENSLMDLSTQLENRWTELKTLDEQVATQRKAQAAVLDAANAGITVQGIYEQNQKSVNDLFLNAQAKDVFGFDVAEKSSLQSIAHQCPLMGGNAVYQARTLLALSDPLATYDDANACMVYGIQWRRAESTPVAAAFKVYPNPVTDGRIILEWDAKLEGDGSVQILDMMGRVIHTQAIYLATQKAVIKGRELVAGAYMMKVMDADGLMIHTDKVVILD
jgi:Secretion system C-terminal sorting domain